MCYLPQHPNEKPILQIALQIALIHILQWKNQFPYIVRKYYKSENNLLQIEDLAAIIPSG